MSHKYISQTYPEIILNVALGQSVCEITCSEYAICNNSFYFPRRVNTFPGMFFLIMFFTFTFCYFPLGSIVFIFCDLK